MSDKEIDKMINNVVASFQIDDIKVSPEFVSQIREKMISKYDKRNLNKKLIKKEK